MSKLLKILPSIFNADDFRPVVFEGFEHYLISRYNGVLFNTRTGKIIKGYLNKNGYRRTYLCNGKRKAQFYFQRIVACAWVDNPDNLPEVNHKDRDRDNNNASNLEHSTKQENLEYRYNRRTKQFYKKKTEPVAYSDPLNSDDLPF